MNVHLRPWGGPDLTLLHGTNTPEMTEHLGGPESDADILARHERYRRLAGTGDGEVFVVEADDGTTLGSIAYWAREWRGSPVYEAGWAVLPAHQRRGVAVAAVGLVVGRAAARHDRTALHAYPSVDHAASNAVCRRAGFTLSGPADFEYPVGTPIRVNDWRVGLIVGA